MREIEIQSETIRVGRQMGFSRSKIVDADNPDRLIALSEGSGVSIGQPPPGFEHVDNPVIDVVDSPSLPPLHVAFGARQRAPGVWELPELSDELSSPDAALHLGPIHVVLEAAAMDLVAHEAGTDAVQVDDWHVMFVARGRSVRSAWTVRQYRGPTGASVAACPCTTRATRTGWSRRARPSSASRRSTSTIDEPRAASRVVSYGSVAAVRSTIDSTLAGHTVRGQFLEHCATRRFGFG